MRKSTLKRSLPLGALLACIGVAVGKFGCSSDPRLVNEKWWFEAALNPHGSERYSLRIGGNRWNQVLGRDRRYCQVGGTNLILFVTGTYGELGCWLYLVTDQGKEACGCWIKYSQIDVPFLGAEQEPPMVEARIDRDGRVEVTSWETLMSGQRSQTKRLRIDLSQCKAVEE